MSKISNEQIKKSIEDALANRKQRKFVETLELQIMLRDYDPEKEKRFNSSTTLNSNCRSHLKVCVIGTIKHLEEAKALGIEGINKDDLKKFNNEAKLIKKWARKFDVLLVSESVNKDVTKSIGRYITSIGKLPVTIGERENVQEKINEMMRTIRFRVKKFPWLAQGFGVDTIGVEELRHNLTKAVNFLVSLLPKGWQNIKSLHVKTTMGQAQRLY